jgi:hypothetical protein
MAVQAYRLLKGSRKAQDRFSVFRLGRYQPRVASGFSSIHAGYSPIRPHCAVRYLSTGRQYLSTAVKIRVFPNTEDRILWLYCSLSITNQERTTP